ncbi:MAG TPA: VOC family protein [Pyrinomonadaceae bacterium]|nr:VOC family protein [Pyrinomonadaceae bacterium]
MRVAEAGEFGAQSDTAASEQSKRFSAGAATLFHFAPHMKINFQRLNHVQLCIPPDTEASAREFYGGLLGLAEIEKPAPLKANGGLWFEIAGIQLHIGVERGQFKSKRHPAFEVENIEAVRSYLEQSGVRTKDEISLAGITRFSFFDPFDNRIELMERATD